MRADDFYIGYLPSVPPDLARRIKRVVATLFVLGAFIASTLVVAQRPFDDANFEFGKVRTFEGTIDAQPHPALVVTHPGANSPSRYLLVAKGKRGADVSAFDGQPVRLQATLIYRDHHTMLEIEPGTLVATGESTAAAAPSDREVELGRVVLTGEVVDTKCYLGVMNPGRGKVHRDCAARCLSGGIPAALLVRDTGALYLLSGSHGAPLAATTLRAVAGEPVTLSGVAFREGETLRLEVSSIQNIPD